jgi:L-fuculose-phosphate aldolase
MDQHDPRFLVAASRRILARGGCESAVAGHVSVRADGEDAFWVSPFEYFDETTPDRVVKADFGLNLLDGDWEPSPAIRFHAALYEGRPDVRSVIHTHSHWVSVFTTRDRPIGMYNVASVLFHDEQVLFADDGTRPPVEGDRLVDALGDRSVILVKNHGAIVVAESIQKATILALVLEQAARYHIEAEAIGGTEFPTAEVVRGKQKYLEHFVPQMWEANLRRLRTSDPELFAFLHA